MNIVINLPINTNPEPSQPSSQEQQIINIDQREGSSYGNS